MINQNYNTDDYTFIQVQFFSTKLYMYALANSDMLFAKPGDLLVVPVQEPDRRNYTEVYKVVRFTREATSEEVEAANFPVSRVITHLGKPEYLDSFLG